MDVGSIVEYVESAQSVIEDSSQMQEATTKASLLNDFVELLGWEIPMNTELEYSVKAFGKTHKVDYALILGGQPAAFLEAKGLDTTLNPDHREQLKDYLRGENVKWGILTNGMEYEFYQRRVIDEKVTVEAVEKTILQQLPSKDKIIGAYQAETIRKQESGVVIEHIRKLRNSWEILTEQKEELATTVVNTLTDSVSDAIESEAKAESKEMIDRLIADIESEIETGDSRQNAESKTSSDTNDENNTESEGYIVELIEGKEIIKTFDDSVQSDLMVNVVDYLIQSHNLISVIEPLPYIPGKKRAIVNSEPTYNGSDMAQPRELEDGYYLEVNLSWSQKQREIGRMAESCGLEATIRED